MNRLAICFRRICLCANAAIDKIIYLSNKQHFDVEQTLPSIQLENFLLNWRYGLVQWLKFNGEIDEHFPTQSIETQACPTEMGFLFKCKCINLIKHYLLWFWIVSIRYVEIMNLLPICHSIELQKKNPLVITKLNVWNFASVFKLGENFEICV